MPSGCSSAQPAGAWHPPPPPSLQTLADSREGLGGGSRGFSRSFDMCIYIWKVTSTALGTPPAPSPAGDAYPLPSRFPLGRKRGVVEGVGVQVWEGGKKFLFLNPCVSFA